MAKLAIALCILATLCGTQAGLSNFMSTLVGQGPEKQLKSLSAEAQETVSDLQSNWSKYLKISSDLLILIEDTASDAIERCIADINELFVRGNLSEEGIALCTNNSELESMLLDITVNKADCIDTKTSEVEPKYNETISHIQDLITTFNDALASIENECGFWNFVSCQSRIATPLLTESKTTVNDLIAESATVLKEIAGLPKKLPDCFSTHALQRIVAQLNTVYADAEKCMNDAKSNSTAEISLNGICYVTPTFGRPAVRHCAQVAYHCNTSTYTDAICVGFDIMLRQELDLLLIAHVNYRETFAATLQSLRRIDPHSFFLPSPKSTAFGSSVDSAAVTMLDNVNTCVKSQVVEANQEVGLNLKYIDNQLEHLSS